MLKDILKKSMKERSLNYAKLAKLAGISDVYVGKIISGARVPSPRILKSISEALDLDYNAMRIEAYKQKAPKGISITFSEGDKSSEIRIKDAGLKNVPILTPDLWDNSRDIQYMMKTLNSVETIEPCHTDDPQAFWIIVPEKDKGNGLIGNRVEPGDYLLVEPNSTPTNGNYVLSLGKEKVELSIFYQTEKRNFYIPVNANGNPNEYLTDEPSESRHYRIGRILTKYN